ncbi:MAG: DUF4760 domain-containing protein, partial [Myxococcota bacterium]
VLTESPGEKLFDMGLKMAAAAFAAYGAIFGRKLASKQNRDRDEQLRSDKLKRTFEVLHYLEDHDRVDRRVELLNAFWDSDKKEPKIKANELRSLKQKLEHNAHELQICLGKTLGSLEDLSLAVRLKYVDEKLVYASMKSIVLKLHAVFYAWINERQQRDPDLYCEFKALAEAWKQGNSLAWPRKRVEDLIVCQPADVTPRASQRDRTSSPKKLFTSRDR